MTKTPVLEEGVMERTRLQVDPRARPGQLEALAPGMDILPTVPTAGTVSKDIGSREKGGGKVV